jgi:hypothetical protein
VIVQAALDHTDLHAYTVGCEQEAVHTTVEYTAVAVHVNVTNDIYNHSIGSCGCTTVYTLAHVHKSSCV